MIKLFRWNIHWAPLGTLLVVVLVAALLALIPQSRGPEPATVTAPAYWPTQGWRSVTPEDQGVDSAKLADALLAIKQAGTRIHSLMIVRNGYLVVDSYFYPYGGSIYHDLASDTKSVMTTLVGIAVDQGKLRLDDTLVSFFPERTIANRDARKERITVRNLANMSSGLQCNERNDEATSVAMRATADWVQFSLDRPMTDEPGTRFVYCSASIHLLSPILQKTTGMTALEFARANLFKPLGIEDVYWPADPQGYTHGWGDLCLRPTDAAKVGFLFWQQGRWEGQQIVSRVWIADATTPHIQTTPGDDNDDFYGYGWWVSPPKAELASYRADGNGGQYIVVVPSLNLIVQTTGGGFSFDDIAGYLEATLVNTGKPLPANLPGAERLQAAMQAVRQGPAVQPVPAPPAIQSDISGQTYVFEGNDIALRSVRLSFGAGSEALLRLDLANEASPRADPVGLDGIYRPSREGRPILAKGAWRDAQTFEADIDEGPGLHAYTLTLRFEVDRVTFSYREPISGASATIEGRQQKNP